MSNIGIEYKGAVGIQVLKASRVNISQNLVEDMPYSGISIGNYQRCEQFSRRDDLGNLLHLNGHHRISRNIVLDTMKEKRDGGGIYVQGDNAHTAIDGNVIMGMKNDYGAGLYIDAGNELLSIKNNVVFDSAPICVAEGPAPYDQEQLLARYRGIGRSVRPINDRSIYNGSDVWKYGLRPDEIYDQVCPGYEGKKLPLNYPETWIGAVDQQSHQESNRNSARNHAAGRPVDAPSGSAHRAIGGT